MTGKHTPSSIVRLPSAYWGMLIIPLGLLGLFHYLPMGGLIMAFKDYRLSAGIFGSEWAGLENFRRLFAADEFWRALRNTFGLGLLRLAANMAAPVMVALMLNEIRLRWFKGTVQTILFIPFLLSWVVLGGMILMIASRHGPINAILGWVGAEPVDFLTSRAGFIGLIVVTSVWQEVGYGVIIYIAALAAIPRDLYEAAAVDGAGRWHQLLHISLPGLRPTITVLFVLSLGRVLTSGFDQIYNLYNPLVYDVGDILDTYILRQMQESLDFSLASAAGLFKSFASGALVLLATAWLRSTKST